MSGGTRGVVRMNNKKRVKKLMDDKKRRCLSEVSEELDIHPREVRKIFLELDKKGYWGKSVATQIIKDVSLGGEDEDN